MIINKTLSKISTIPPLPTEHTLLSSSPIDVIHEAMTLKKWMNKLKICMFIWSGHHLYVDLFFMYFYLVLFSSQHFRWRFLKWNILTDKMQSTYQISTYGNISKSNEFSIWFIILRNCIMPFFHVNFLNTHTLNVNYFSYT